MIYILLNKLKINKKFNKYYFKVKNSKFISKKFRHIFRNISVKKTLKIEKIYFI